MLMVLSSRNKSLQEFIQVHLMNVEQRQVAADPQTKWLPTLRPSQPTWAVSPPIGRYHPHPVSSRVVEMMTLFMLYFYLSSTFNFTWNMYNALLHLLY